MDVEDHFSWLHHTNPVCAFLFCPKELRVCLLLSLSNIYLLKPPVQPEVKQLAKSSQPAAVK